jgi:invasion protein IalB
MMRSVIAACSAAVSVCAALCLGGVANAQYLSQAQMQQIPGGWSASCQNAQVSGTVLYAECYDQNGYLQNTFVDLANCNTSVENNNGQLICAGAAAQPQGGGGANAQLTLPFGNWVDVCWAANVRNGRMEAECDNGRGQMTGSAIDLAQCGSNSLTVSKGKLRCDNGSSPGQFMGRLPGGDWVGYCWTARNDNGIMQAQCYDAGGNVVSSQLDVTTCPANDVSVGSGSLYCR